MWERLLPLPEPPAGKIWRRRPIVRMTPFNPDAGSCAITNPAQASVGWWTMVPALLLLVLRQRRRLAIVGLACLLLTGPGRAH
ncbi:MAG: hypothetical protein KIT69_21810, partial [Propionibacteriaceae bacterium]|nr:hypothetical protein [Propionibacteriaceae bacterium]